MENKLFSVILLIIFIIFVILTFGIRNKLNEYESDIFGTYMTGTTTSGNAEYLVFEKGKVFSYRQNDVLTELACEELSDRSCVAEDNQGGKLYFIKGVEDGKVVVYMLGNMQEDITLYEKIDDKSLFINVKH